MTIGVLPQFLCRVGEQPPPLLTPGKALESTLLSGNWAACKAKRAESYFWLLLLADLALMY